MSIPDSVELAAEVVAAFVANNPLPRSELPALIEAVKSAIEGLGKKGWEDPSLKLRRNRQRYLSASR
jgi:predicted transcriptional regulator